MQRHDVNLAELEPSEVIKPLELSSYEKSLNLVWMQLVYLNSILFILKKLLEFPIDLSLGPNKSTFFSVVKISLFDLILHYL